MGVGWGSPLPTILIPAGTLANRKSVLFPWTFSQLLSHTFGFSCLLFTITTACEATWAPHNPQGSCKTVENTQGIRWQERGPYTWILGEGCGWKLFPNRTERGTVFVYSVYLQLLSWSELILLALVASFFDTQEDCLRVHLCHSDFSWRPSLKASMAAFTCWQHVYQGITLMQYKLLWSPIPHREPRVRPGICMWGSAA